MELRQMSRNAGVPASAYSQAIVSQVVARLWCQSFCLCLWPLILCASSQESFMTRSYGGCGDCWSQDRSQHAEAASHGSPLLQVLSTPSSPRYMLSLSECSLHNKCDRASPLLITLNDSCSPRTKSRETHIHTWPGLPSIANHLLCWHPTHPSCFLASPHWYSEP